MAIPMYIMPVSIFASTDDLVAVTEALNSLPALAGQVLLIPCDDPQADTIPRSAFTLLIQHQQIESVLDWHNELPPLVYPTVPFTAAHLAGLIYAKLGDHDTTHSYEGKESGIPELAEQQVMLQEQWIFDHIPSAPTLNDWRNWHNYAVVLHYGQFDLQTPDAIDVEAAYKKALELAPTDEAYWFTTKQLATLLADGERATEAEQYLRKCLEMPGHPAARASIQALLCSTLLDQLVVPYDPVLLEELKHRLWENLTYFELAGRRMDEALLLLDAAHIANISNSFSESLGYLTRAIKILEEEDQPELAAQAQLKKGLLLFTWAQQDQPQFYRGALDALLAALRVFKRETEPGIFADIHHYLGIIYSEIPDEVKKKSVWAAVSVSSFQEAQQYYNKVDSPYEFGMICHHFGNAYTRYPAAVHSDNFEKALAWYREALDVRPASLYPIERSHTLSNYLAASWEAGNPEDGFHEARYQDMVAKATELLQITSDANLQQEARQHLETLNKLREQELQRIATPSSDN